MYIKYINIIYLFNYVYYKFDLLYKICENLFVTIYELNNHYHNHIINILIKILLL